MKLIITGGHLAPALSIINSLPKDCEILLIGRKHTLEGDTNLSFEYQTAKALKIPFYSITTGRLQRTFTRYTIDSLLKFPIGFFQAFGIIKDFQPDVILSFGGYVCLPVVLAGKLLHVSIVIHEQTLGAGLANRITSWFASKICISWKSSEKFFSKKKTVLTGLPIKNFPSQRLIGLWPKLPNENLPLLYVTGGSAGSHTINILIEGCLKRLLKHYRIIHQTGDNFDFKDFDRLQTVREKLDRTLKEHYILTKFIEPFQVGSILDACDIVVSRSGINTVTELMLFGKPALLIPLNKEQETNAIFLKNLGLVEVADQETLTSETLCTLLLTMLSCKTTYTNNAKKAKDMLILDAHKRIREVIEETVRK